MYIDLFTTFNFTIRYPYFIDHGDEVTLDIVVTPNFEGISKNLEDDCLILDIHTLIKCLNLTTPIIDYPLTCECGDPKDIGIEKPMKIYQKNQQLFWEADISAYQDILSTFYQDRHQDTLRLIFSQEQFHKQVVNLIQTLKVMIQKGIPLKQIHPDDFTKSYGSAHQLSILLERNPVINHLMINEIKPYDCSFLDYILTFTL